MGLKLSCLRREYLIWFNHFQFLQFVFEVTIIFTTSIRPVTFNISVEEALLAIIFLKERKGDCVFVYRWGSNPLLSVLLTDALPSKLRCNTINYYSLFFVGSEGLEPPMSFDIIFTELLLYLRCN